MPTTCSRPALPLLLLAAWGAPGASAAGAPPAARLGIPLSIEDPSGRALDPLHAALRQAELGAGQARIVFYGASHVASDLFTGHVRRALQKQFGDAGHGFVMPARPWPRYRHADVNLESSLGWETRRIRSGNREPGCYGLAGMSVAASDASQFGAVWTTHDNPVGRRADLFELFYWRQPGGGTLDVLLDAEPARQLSTESTFDSLGYARFHAEDGPHRLEVRPRGDGEVRLFGLAVERRAPGVIVDTLGINGARAAAQLYWDEGCTTSLLRFRRPNLVVLAYGTNESGDSGPIERYAGSLRRVVGRVRTAVPEAACLLVGPSDLPARLGRRGWQLRPRNVAVNEVQRAVSTELGCGFFDVIAFMGGPGSMARWSVHRPPYGAPDRVHFTRLGYRRLGEVLTAALLEGYEGAGARQ